MLCTVCYIYVMLTFDFSCSDFLAENIALKVTVIDVNKR
jgi:hypothetical protein